MVEARKNNPKFYRGIDKDGKTAWRKIDGGTSSVCTEGTREVVYGDFSPVETLSPEDRQNYFDYMTDTFCDNLISRDKVSCIINNGDDIQELSLSREEDCDTVREYFANHPDAEQNMHLIVDVSPDNPDDIITATANEYTLSTIVSPEDRKYNEISYQSDGTYVSLSTSMDSLMHDAHTQTALSTINYHAENPDGVLEEGHRYQYAHGIARESLHNSDILDTWNAMMDKDIQWLDKQVEEGKMKKGHGDNAAHKLEQWYSTHCAFNNCVDAAAQIAIEKSAQGEYIDTDDIAFDSPEDIRAVVDRTLDINDSYDDYPLRKFDN